MAGFGEKLREAREKMGLSIEYVEEETKIRRLYLEALEKEAFTVLPARVYAIGFVKSYAQYLNLDADKLSREFKELAYGSLEEEKEEEMLPIFRESVQKKPLLSQIPMKNIFFAAAFLLLAIWAGNFLLDYIGSNIGKHEAGKTPPSNQVTNPPPKNPVDEPPAASKTLDMVIKVKPDMRCWVLVRVDGEEKLQEILASNQERSFSAKDTIFIKAGNAGAIDVFINNKKQEPLGKIGDVAEKEYNNGGKD